MMELVKIGLDTLGGLIAGWIKGSAEERAELEKRVVDGIAVMRGERQATHEALDASEAETRRIIAEEKAKLAKVEEPTKP